MPLDAHELARATAEIVKGHVAAATAPLLRRIEALEARQPERGEKGDRGETGVGMAGAMIDRSGVLVLTLSNGEVRELGPVVGKDGRDGIDGKDGADGTPGADGRDGIDGKDGAPGKDGKDGVDGLSGKDGRDGADGEKGVDGKDGRDGFSLTDFEIVQDQDPRVVTLAFGQDINRKTAELRFPVIIDRGVWKEGEYDAGDGVTWGGSWWIAQRSTSAKPDSPDSGWRLAVKKGRDGKDAAKA